MVFAVAAVAAFGFAVAATVALAVSALAVILVFGFDVALRTGAFLADALLAGALLGDWERDFVVIGKSAYQNVLKFFAAFSSNLDGALSFRALLVRQKSASKTGTHQMNHRAIRAIRAIDEAQKRIGLWHGHQGDGEPFRSC
ncbi:MAG: hypothetical protein R3F19_14135 [Verrucomicrobiales bacterium]